jgi:GDP-L-fucose synthase
MLSPTARIMVAGARGMVGRAIVAALRDAGYEQVIEAARDTVDFGSFEQTKALMDRERPDFVFVAAARVGGIWANSSRPAEFLYQNLNVSANIIHAAHLADVPRLLYLGSSCIYPKAADQPIKEEYLLGGPLEATNEAYAIAKIAGIKLCGAYSRQYARGYYGVMPTNLYGPGDNYDPASSHVLPALIRKAHMACVEGASTMTVWGSGRPRREFLHVHDLARACVHLMSIGYEGDILNIGVGEDIEIGSLAQMICEIVGYEGRIEYDSSMPDGTPRKLLDISRIRALGWHPTIPLREGIGDVYREVRSQFMTARAGTA